MTSVRRPNALRNHFAFHLLVALGVCIPEPAARTITLQQKAVGDEAFRRQIKENPEAALAGYDLTADEKAAIKSGDAARLRALGVDERITKSTLWDPTGTGDTKPWG